MGRETRAYGSRNACLCVEKHVSMGREARAYGSGNACICVGKLVSMGRKTRVYGSGNACQWVVKRVPMGRETRAYGSGPWALRHMNAIMNALCNFILKMISIRSINLVALTRTSKMLIFVVVSSNLSTNMVFNTQKAR